MVKTAVVYESKTGNTAMAAGAIQKVCGNQSIFFGAPGEIPSGIVSRCDLIFAGSWTDKGSFTPDMAEFIKGLDRKKVAIFGTAGFGGSEEYFSQLTKRITGLLAESCELVGSYFCQGKMPPSVKARYEAMLKEHPDDPGIRSSIENFDRALSHPDAVDLDGAADFARLMLKLAESKS